MKILIVGFIYGVILIWSNNYHVTDGQYFENVTLFYKPLKFDSFNRGAYNISVCLKDILNCWELVKPDYVCAYDHTVTTLCDFMKNHCHDYYGKIDDIAGAAFVLHEGSNEGRELCYNRVKNVYTK